MLCNLTLQENGIYLIGYCRVSDVVYNEMSFSYLKYGKIKINIPFFIKLFYKDEQAMKATDFLA